MFDLACPLCAALPREQRIDRVSRLEAMLDTDALLPLLSVRTKQRVLAALDRFCAHRCGRFVQCPAIGCEFSQQLWSAGGGGGDVAANSEKKKTETALQIACPEHGLHCALCFEPIAAAEKKSSSTGRSSSKSTRNAQHQCYKTLADFPQEHDVRHCPECQCLIEKWTGCNSMICGNCNNRFSWQDAKAVVPAVVVEKGAATSGGGGGRGGRGGGNGRKGKKK